MNLPGSVPSVPPVTVDGTTSIDDELKDFDTYLQSKYPNTPSTALPRPYVDDVVHPAASEDFGINDEIAEPGGEVTVIIRLNEQVSENESIMLFWGERVVAGGIVDKSEVGRYKTFKVPSNDVPEGVSSLYYEIYKGYWFTDNPRSPEVSTLFRKGQPGVDGEKGKDEELGKPEIGKPAISLIGPIDASAGIKVIIPAYLSMNVLDVIYLYWGDVVLTHTVKQADLQKPIEMLVPESAIKAAGDSKALQINYYVEDLVGNESEWSVDAFVEVNLTDTSLEAPVVLDDNGAVLTTGTIDINAIDLPYVRLQILGQFKAGDSISLHFVGTSHQGQSTAKDFGPLVVADPNKPQHIDVPYDEWVHLGGGNARFSFTLTPKTGSPSTSKKRYINVTGVLTLLPPPEIHEATDSSVDADLKYINVMVSEDAKLQNGDRITLFWAGTKADGSVLTIPVKEVPVTQGMAGKQIAVRLSGPTFIKVLEGGFVVITYKVTRKARVLKSEEAAYDVGEPAETLPAPSTEIALVNNVLDPDKDEYKFNMVVDIPQSAVQPTPCTLYLHWTTSQGDYHNDELEVPANSTGPYSFTVARDVYEPKGNSPVQCTVYYAIEWPGKPTHVSHDLVFDVATPAMLSSLLGAPSVPRAVNGKLNLTTIIDNVFPVRIDDPGLKVGDEITIKVGAYTSRAHLLTTHGVQDLKLPLDQVLAQNMQSLLEPAAQPLHISYERVLNGAQVSKASRTLPIVLEGAITRERFEGFNRRRIHDRCDLPALRIVMKKGVNSVGPAYVRAGTHARALVVGGYANTHTRFELRGLASKVEFYLTGHTIRNNSIIFYTAAGTPIKTINTLFNRSPGKVGYQPYTERVSFLSPSAAIAAFEFVESHGDANHYIFDIQYVPF